jgi:CRISPR-associated protein Cst2
MKLTGLLLIETGVVNRGENIGILQTLKKLSTHEGVKVVFSRAAYLSALWETLKKEPKLWKTPITVEAKGKKKSSKSVTQKHGTIIDSEELDLAGTMTTEEGNESKRIGFCREGAFTVLKGISINNYMGDTNFGTSGRLVKVHGYGDPNIYQKEDFYGIYMVPVSLEVERVGVQEIPSVEPDFRENDSMVEKIKKLYEKLGVLNELLEKFREEELPRLAERVEVLEKTDKGVRIVLTKEERYRRIKDLLETIGDFSKRIEGGDSMLSPVFSVFSTDYNSHRFLYPVKDFVSRKIREMEPINWEEAKAIVQEFAKNEGRTVYPAVYYEYYKVLAQVLAKIRKALGIEEKENAQA